MKLLIYMKDGRTCYRLTGRGYLAQLLRRSPGDEEKSVQVERGIWNPITGEYLWGPAWIRYIAMSSISAIEEDKLAYKPAEAAA